MRRLCGGARTNNNPGTGKDGIPAADLVGDDSLEGRIVLESDVSRYRRIIGPKAMSSIKARKRECCETWPPPAIVRLVSLPRTKSAIISTAPGLFRPVSSSIALLFPEGRPGTPQLPSLRTRRLWHPNTETSLHLVMKT